MIRRLLFYGLLICALLPIPTHGQEGAYNTITKTFWCDTQYVCLHEQAHYIDWSNNKISASTEYRVAVVSYVILEAKTNKSLNTLDVKIINLLDFPMSEIYAHIYAETNGNVPEALKEFYPVLTVKFCSIPLMKGRLYYAVCHTCN